MKIKLKDIEQNNGQLKGLPKNPRYIKDERYEAMKQSLTDDPEMTELRELVVYPLPDSKGKYIAIGGNMRLRAMKDLGWKEAEAIVLKKETPLAKLREYGGCMQDARLVVGPVRLDAFLVGGRERG